MSINFENSTWIYLRELSNNVDRTVMFIQNIVPRLSNWYWNRRYVINAKDEVVTQPKEADSTKGLQDKPLVNTTFNHLLENFDFALANEGSGNLKNNYRPVPLSPEKLGQNIAMALLIVYLGTVGIITLAIRSESANGIRLVNLNTGSMVPDITPGTAVITKQQNDYFINDVITYQEVNPTSGNFLPSTVTHRIVKKINSPDGDVFVTKGDANKIPDPVLVKDYQILGRVVVRINFLGYFISYLKTLPGFLALIVFPSLLLIYNEVQYLWLQYNLKKVNFSE